MFYAYKIENNILYLYVNDKCEIGSFFADKNTTLSSKIKKYIKDMKINFNGVKVVLILSGILLGSVYLNNDKNIDTNVYKGNKYVSNLIVHKSNIDELVSNKIDEVLNNVSTNIDINKEVVDNNTINNKKEVIVKENIINNTVNESNSINKKDDIVKEEVIYNNEIYIDLHKTTGEVEKMKLEDYLVGVVASEMPASFNIEAIKAQAVASRTYAMKLIESNRVITDNISTQNYMSNDSLKEYWQGNYNAYYNKIKTAVESTKGMYMTYNGSIIDAVYHSTSNGYTENSKNVWGNEIPYLISVSSPWDTSSTNFIRITDFTYDEISKKLGYEVNKDTFFNPVVDENNRVVIMWVNDKSYSGVEFRNLIGLRSTDFEIEKNNDYISIKTRGYGHGVGLSQYGSNGMANSGYTYDKILKHYYTGIDIIKK